MGFTQSQHGGVTEAAVATQTASFTNPPALGDLVVVCVYSGTSSAITVSLVQDGNSNTFSKTPNSPSTFLSSAGQVSCYYLIAPANASKTINVTQTGGPNQMGFIMEDFTVAGGTAQFDKDATAEPGASGTPCNTPTITPTHAGSLLYAFCCPTGSVTAPAAGASLGGWTGAGQGLQDSDGGEYQLNATGLTSPDFTLSSSTGWSSIAAAFFIGNSPDTFVETLQFQLQ